MRHDLRRLLGLAAAVASLAAVAPPATAAAASARTTVFASKLWKLEAIAMDGSNVAMARNAVLETFSPGGGRPMLMICREVNVANIASRRLVRLSLRSRGYYCNGGFGGTSNASFLALAGSRAYWVYLAEGNFLYQSLFTGAPGSAQRTLLSYPFGVDPFFGPFIGPLAANGTTFAYSQWQREPLPPGCDPNEQNCTPSAPTDFTLTLHGSRIALPAPGGVVASVDDAGHAAVMLSSQGRVAIVAHNAHATITTPIPGVSGRVADAALAGRWLVALAGTRIWAFDSQNGHLRASWPAPGATHVDVWNGIAVFATRRQVIAVRLSNGHAQLIQQLSRGRTVVGAAQIESGGIVWATQPVRDTDRHGLNAIYRVPVPHLH